MRRSSGAASRHRKRLPVRNVAKPLSRPGMTVPASGVSTAGTCSPARATSSVPSSTNSHLADRIPRLDQAYDRSRPASSALSPRSLYVSSSDLLSARRTDSGTRRYRCVRRYVTPERAATGLFLIHVSKYSPRSASRLTCGSPGSTRRN